MENESSTDGVTTNWPGLYAIGALVLLSIAAQIFLGISEDPGVADGDTRVRVAGTIVFAVPGAYLLIAGAVGRAIQLVSRR